MAVQIPKGLFLAEGVRTIYVARLGAVVAASGFFCSKRQVGKKVPFTKVA